MDDEASRHIHWNFGNPDDEAAALSTGNKSKISKVSKAVEKERISFQDPKRVSELMGETKRFRMVFAGPVSNVMTGTAIPLVSVFGMQFYVNPVPAPTPISLAVVPAWMVGTTKIPNAATVIARKSSFDYVPSLSLVQHCLA